MLIPLQCETLSHRGVGQLLDTIADVRRLTNQDLVVLGVLPTLYDGRTTHSRAVLADVTERFGVPVLEPPIGRSDSLCRGTGVRRVDHGDGVFEPWGEAYREHARRLAGEEVAA